MYIKNKRLRNKRGQSTVEYVLLVTAVVAVIIAFVTGNNSAFNKTLNATLNSSTQDMQTMDSKLTDSHNSPTGGSGTPSYNINVAP